MEINIWQEQDIIPILFKMIPAKIITFEEAKKEGLIYDGPDLSGESICGAMCVAKKEKKPGAKEILLEKHILRKNGRKELIFIHEDRKKDLQKLKSFEVYLDQFDVIEGLDKETFLKNNNLKIPRDPK